jgi:pre-mRNA-splicing factor SYF1
MPRIWLDFCNFLIEQKQITRTRHVFDRALMSLPVTQHDKIWEYYLDWVVTLPSSQTAICIYNRYIKLNPDIREDFIEYLIGIKRYDEVVTHTIKLLDDDLFYSKKGKSKFDYWMLICDIISRYPDKVKQLDCENIIRHGLNKYTDEVGRLWVSLCNYYIRQGLFDKARDIFEEGLSKITTARDFSLIFNAYLKFEEEVVKNLLELENEEEEENEINNYEKNLNDLIENSFMQLEIKVIEKGEIHNEFDIKNKNKENEKKNIGRNKKKDNSNNSNYNNNNNFTLLDQEKEANKNNINLKLFKISNLIERRPFLLSDAIIRQNPNNVKEWLKRVKLCNNDKELIIATFEKAINTINQYKAFGKLENLYIEYAKFYEGIDSLGKANETFHRATQLNFRSLDSYANIWCEWSEMHLRCGNHYDAYCIAKRGCTTTNNNNNSYKKNKDEGGNMIIKIKSNYLFLLFFLFYFLFFL